MRCLGPMCLGVGRLLSCVALLPAGACHRAAPPSAHPSVTRGVAGIVYDSVAHVALSDALVQFADAAHPARRPIAVHSDSSGAFSAAELPAGKYIATFYHPRLEELGLLPPTYVVTVGATDGVWFDLSIPSGPEVHNLYCGAHAPGGAEHDSSAALIGRVFEASSRLGARHATVTAAWYSFDFTDGLRRIQLQTHTNDDGAYAICGLPPADNVMVEATLDDRRTDEIPVKLPARGVATRDLLVGQHRRIVMHGNVIGSNGGPVAHAHIAVEGLDGGVTADENGIFALPVPHEGTLMVATRAIGFGADERAVNLYADSTQWVEIDLPRLQLLDTVFVNRMRTLDRTGFEDRRAEGSGTFFTQSDLQVMRPTATLDLLRHSPSMNVVQSLPGKAVLRVRGEACLPMLYIDRFPVPLLNDVAELDALVDPTSIKAAELYTRPLIPREFSRGDPCAALVVWTRR